MRVIQEKIENAATVLLIALLTLAVLSLPIWLFWLSFIVIDWIAGNG